MDIILNYIYPPPVLWRCYSFTWRKLCLSRGFLVFLASIWSSLSLELDVYVKMSFACLAPCDSNVAVFGKCCWLLCTLYIPLLVLVWLCSHFWFHRSLASHRRSWKIRLFPKPVGRITKHLSSELDWLGRFLAPYLALGDQPDCARHLIGNKWGNQQRVDSTVKIIQSEGIAASAIPEEGH